jgi:hypothetical protein
MSSFKIDTTTPGGGVVTNVTNATTAESLQSSDIQINGPVTISGPTTVVGTSGQTGTAGGLSVTATGGINGDQHYPANVFQGTTAVAATTGQRLIVGSGDYSGNLGQVMEVTSNSGTAGIGLPFFSASTDDMKIGSGSNLDPDKFSIGTLGFLNYTNTSGATTSGYYLILRVADAGDWGWAINNGTTTAHDFSA